MTIKHGLMLGLALGGAQILGGGPTEAKDVAVTYQIDPAHDGHAVLKSAFTGPLKQKWARDLGGAVSYPLIAGGMVFVTVANSGAYGTQLYALNLRTGETVWQKAISGTYYWSNAAYDSGRIFVVNFDGQLQAFAADSVGTPEWSVQLPGQYAFSAPPTAVQGQVFVGGAGSGGTLYAVDESTGHVNWTQGVANGDDSSPAVGNKGVYVTYPCQYYKFDPGSGATLWHTSRGCDGGGGDTPVYFDRRLYVRDWAEGNVVLDAGNGGILGPLTANAAPAFWQSSSGQKLELSLYGGALNAIDLATGTAVWSFAGDGGLDSAPITINGSVVIGSSSGNLYLLDAASGGQLWSGNAGAPIGGSGGCCAEPVTGLAAAENRLIVPASTRLVAYVSEK